MSRRIAIIGAGPGGSAWGSASRGRASSASRSSTRPPASAAPGTGTVTRAAPATSPSHLYSFSFELKRDWSRPYAPQPEILATWSTARRSTACSRTAASATGCGARAGTRPRRSGRSSWARAGPSSPTSWSARSACSTRSRRPHPGARRVRRHGVPLRALERGARPHRGVGRRHRQRGERGAARARDREAGGARPPVPAHGELGRCRSRTTRTPRSSSIAFATIPGFAEKIRRNIFDRSAGPASTTRVRPDMEAACRAGMAVVEDPALRERLAPDHPWGVQAPALLQRLVPGVQPAEPRARHRPDRARHPDRRRDRRRPRAPARHADPRDRLRGDEVPRRRSTSPAGAGARSPTRGATAPRPTRASRRRASRTSSCSTGRTRTPTRSSTMIEYQADHVLRQIQRIEREALAWLDVKPAAMAAYNDEIQRSSTASSCGQATARLLPRAERPHRHAAVELAGVELADASVLRRRGRRCTASARTLRLFGQFESLCGKSASHMILSTPMRSRFESRTDPRSCTPRCAPRRPLTAAPCSRGLRSGSAPRCSRAVRARTAPTRHRPPTARRGSSASR